MKNLKRLIAALIAVTMICALSVTSFAAFTQGTNYYTFKIEFENSKGETVTDFVAGETIKMHVSLVETATDTGITYEYVGSATPTFKYGIVLTGLLANTEVQTSNGDCTIAGSGPYALSNVLDGYSTFDTDPIATHTFTVGSAGTYTAKMSSFGLADGAVTVKANGAVKPTVTGTITEAAAGNKVDDLGAAAAEVKEAFAGKYYITGTAIAGASVEKYVTATDGSKTVSTQRKIGEMINASGSVAVTVVPVLIVSESDAAKSFTFGLADAPISK
ncbi:MAG: hypothetical protein IJD30_01375 [Clostridia bacterium]|nr:hypothetical protein [Clostridia bacterium]